MLHSQCARWFQLGLVLFISQIATVVQAASPGDEVLIAQIIPDDTLGSESSLFTDGTNSGVIHGGAIRGVNLFHSFQDFNINTGQQVYFLNPEGIETILSRITGNNVSNIDGLLGVDGTADLFLLNPNGITFGPNAELDIRGAFTASTAGTLEFSDGNIFSATNPQGASFLTMSAPLGVQFGVLPQGDIASTGVLETGEDLTLLGNQLYLEGQLIAGNDLTLQARDTVTIRDTATDAFIARSGDDLTIQGNQGIDIWTLQHLEQTPFISGGNLILISDGAISGDAHLESGGNLKFLTLAGTPGDFVSFYDPIIFADGNIVFGNYTGVSLKVEATGSIQGGNINISGPDTTLTVDGSGSDEDLLASNRTAILRAGAESVSTPNLPQMTGGTTFEEDNIDRQPPGSIVVNNIIISDTRGANGGIIILDGDGAITTSQLGVSASAENSTLGNAGNGGNISISSNSGDILIEGIVGAISVSTEPSGNASDGGNISISSNSGNITINGDVSSASAASSVMGSGSTGYGGEIVIASGSGDISINGKVSSNTFSHSGIAADGGVITISSTSGNVAINETLNSGSSTDIGAAGSGGAIAISSTSGSITTNEALTSSSLSFDALGTAGNGGAISISSTSGNIAINETISSSSSDSDTAKNGGTISISSTSGNITINDTLSSFSFASEGNTGDGGDISLRTKDGVILGNNNQVIALSVIRTDGVTRAGGTVNLEALNISDLGVFTFSSTGTSGDIQIQGSGESLTVSDLSLVLIPIDLTIPNPFNPQEDIVLVRGLDINQRGITSINSSGNLNLNNIDIQSSARQSANAGNVEISSDRNIQLNNSNFFSNTNNGSSGNGGNVSITGIESITINSSLIKTDTEGSGSAGSISIMTPLLNIQNGARVTAETNSPIDEGIGGTVVIGADEINLSGSETIVSVSTSGPAPAGSVILQPKNSDSIEINTLGEGPQISASTGPGSSGAGGNITIRDAVVAKLDNTEFVTSGNGSGRAGSIFVENVDVLLMRRGSLILAEASDTGGGGNVVIDAGFAFTIPEEDNDILVNASFGQGGMIDITANLIVGFREVEQFSPNLRGNRISDINASSEFDIDGTIRLDADPAPELTELPTDLIDPANRIAQGCRAEDFTINDGPPGDFIITGRGGQRLEPSDIASEDAPLDDLGPDITQPGSSMPDTESSLPSNQQPISLADSQTAIVTESGEVFLISDSAWQPSVSCTALSQSS